MGVALAAVTADVVAGGRLARAEASRCGAPGPATRWARWASRASEREALALVVLAAAVRRRAAGRPAWPPAVRLAAGAVARTAFARAVRRSRPPESWWRTEPEGWSYPSRHTTHAVMAAAVVLEEVVPAGPRVSAVGVLAAAAVVGAGRVRLGVHWPTDVVGGALTGLVWVRLTARLRCPLRPRHRGRDSGWRKQEGGRR